MHKPAPDAPKRGRPPGSTHANGAAPTKSRLNETERARLAHWRAWWVRRPGGRPSAAGLAARMEKAAPTVADYAAGRRTPGPVALANLESLCAAEGYEPLTADFQFP